MTIPRTMRLRVAVFSLAVLAFAAGVAAGVLGDRLLAPRVRVRSSVGDMSAVLNQLGLTTEQRRVADSIVARRSPQSHAIMLEIAERLQGVADSADAELRAVLTPQQRLRLDSLRSPPRFLLKRKTTPLGSAVDTVLDIGPKTPRP